MDTITITLTKKDAEKLSNPISGILFKKWVYMTQEEREIMQSLIRKLAGLGRDYVRI